MIHGWRLEVAERITESSRPELESFRRNTRDLYIPAGDTGFWQAALRDPNDGLYPSLLDVIQRRQRFTIDVLYGDHEGGQRTISRFSIAPAGDAQWLCSVVRHWNLDRPDPR